MSTTNFPLVSGVNTNGGSDRVLSYANVGAFPATGAVGYVYIDEANADMYLWTGAVYELQGGTSAVETGFWSQKPVFPTSLNYFIEEFDFFPIQISNGAGNLYAVIAGTSAAIQPRDASETNYGINSTEKAVGVTSLNPGSTTPGRAALGWGGAQSAASFKIGILEMIFGMRSSMIALGSAGENYTVYIGFMDIITAAPTNGVYFRYNYNVNGGRWEYCTTVSSSTTAADTGIAPSATVYQVMEIKINAAGTSATFYIDGTLCGTITTGFPTGGLLAMGSTIRAAGIGTGGAGIVGVDAMYMATERLAVR